MTCTADHVEETPDTSDVEDETGTTPRKPLGFFGLLVLIFYSVSGGPFGSEASVRAGGPLFALLGFIIFPVFWSLPQALMTAELSTTFPDDGGYVIWVREAFGSFWGFQVGFLSVVCGLIDLAIYPVLCIAYLNNAICGGVSCPIIHEPIVWYLPSLRIIIVIVFACVLSYLNYRGLDLVENVTIGLTVFTLLPFVILVCMGLPHLQPSRWADIEATGGQSDYDWFTFANVLFWNLNYWDSASSLAGEVSNPAKTFPRAMGFAGVMVVATYLLPMSVCIAALPAGQTWETGFYVQAGKMLGGRLLENWILAAAAMGSVGQFISNQTANNYLLLGMAELGYLPRAFAARSKYGTPTLGIFVTFACVIILSPFKVVELIGLINGVGVLSDLIIYASFLELRRRRPELHRPYRVPLSLAGCIVMLVGPMCVMVILLALPIWQQNWAVLGFTLVSIIVGVLVYWLLAICRKYFKSCFLEQEAVVRPGSGKENFTKLQKKDMKPQELEPLSGETSIEEDKCDGTLTETIGKNSASGPGSCQLSVESEQLKPQ